MSVTKFAPPQARHPRPSRPETTRPRPRFARILSRPKPRAEAAGRR